MKKKDEAKNNSSCWPSTNDASVHQENSSAKTTDSQNTEHCMVCGATLEYLEQAQDLTCTYCKKAEHGHIRCPNGHYICDICHNKDAIKIIEDIAFTTQSKDPVEISNLMMSYPGLPMLGCQHAYIAGGALMAALKNEGSRGINNENIKEVFQRTGKQAHGGYCGLTGVCGIAPAIGACFAILTGSKCGTEEEQRLTMEAVTRVSMAIAKLTGPSCCKAYVWAALLIAVEILKESFDIILPIKDLSITCTYSGKHPHGCRQTKCLYFNDGTISKSLEDISSNPMNKYDEFFAMVYSRGAMDIKTKHLVALSASLAAGCQPWTDYSLAVARKYGATEREINEAMMIAMTVGAHKVRLMAEKGISNHSETAIAEQHKVQEGECKTWTP